MKCKNCKAQINATDKFCKNCGERNNNDHSNQYNYSTTYSSSTKSDYNSNHQEQFNYSFNYSNTTKPDYNLNDSHIDQFNYNYDYSYDPKKYEYASTYRPTGDDKYIQTYIGPNYNAIKKVKFSIPALLFGVYYLLYRKVWGYALIYIIINAAAQLLLDESLASAISLILNIYVGFKFNTIYMKKVESHVEKIKQENLDKTTTELLEICKKKGGTSMTGPIIGVVGIILLVAAAIILLISMGYLSDYNSTEQQEDIIETDNSLSYTLPEGFKLNYESGVYKSYRYTGESIENSCNISVETNTLTNIYKTEDEYLEKHVIITNSNEKVDPIKYINVNNKTWKYIHKESTSISETQYAILENNKYYIVKTYDYKTNNIENTICNNKYKEFISTLIFSIN